MRLFFLLTLCFALIGSPTFSFAQDAESQNQVDASSVEDVSKQSLYKEASNTQLKEAQRFYKYCRNNDDMKAIKDCKCAATKFLEARMELGAEVSARDVMKKGTNSCLKFEEPQRTNESDVDMSAVTDVQLEEAQKFYKKCAKDRDLSTEYDCKCMSANFLQKRIELGPLPNEDLIFLEIRDTCPNVVETTGAQYSACMGKAVPLGLGNIGIKEFCECIAREWAKAYKRLGGQLDISLRGAVQSSARLHCKNPGLYQ